MDIFLYGLVFLFSLLLTYLLIRYKDKINLSSHPNHRTVHKGIIPSSGGIAILLSFLFGLLLFDTGINIENIVAVVLVFFLGLYDDYFGASSKQKIFFLFVVANILYFSGIYIENLGTYLGSEVLITGFVTYLFLVFVVVGFVNSVNLIDGLDGLASTIGIIILSSFLYLGIKFNDSYLIYMTSIYISSVLGYLYFNWSPAKIFMGDAGSLVLGIVILLVSIHAVNMHYITPITILMLAALPILDTILVMSRRILWGISPFTADKLHMHHIILKHQKNNTRKTVFILGLLQAVFTYLGLGFKTRDDILILVLFLMLVVLLYVLLMPMKKDTK